MQRQAQEAAEALISSEAAERARQLAAQATQQATEFAQQATIKAQVAKSSCSPPPSFMHEAQEDHTNLTPNGCLQEVAKEAMGEAEKSISAFRHKASR